MVGVCTKKVISEFFFSGKQNKVKRRKREKNKINKKKKKENKKYRKSIRKNKNIQQLNIIEENLGPSRSPRYYKECTAAVNVENL